MVARTSDTPPSLEQCDEEADQDGWSYASEQKLGQFLRYPYRLNASQHELHVEEDFPRDEWLESFWKHRKHLDEQGPRPPRTVKPAPTSYETAGTERGAFRATDEPEAGPCLLGAEQQWSCGSTCRGPSEDKAAAQREEGCLPASRTIDASFAPCTFPLGCNSSCKLGQEGVQCCRCKQVGTSMFDHTCPQCKSLVCEACLDDFNVLTYRCPHCSEEGRNRSALQQRLRARSAYRAAESAFGALGNAAWSLLGLFNEEAAPPCQPLRTQGCPKLASPRAGGTGACALKPCRRSCPGSTKAEDEMSFDDADDFVADEHEKIGVPTQPTRLPVELHEMWKHAAVYGSSLPYPF